MNRHIRRQVMLAALFLAACRLREAGPDPRVVETWNRHEAAVVKAIGGHQEGDEFDDACLFFERVAGIEIHANIFTLGIVPEPEAKDDLIKIRAWYATNWGRLFWDEKDKSVKVKPPNG